MEDPKVNNELFNKLKKQLLMIDPVAFCEEYLTLDGKPFRLTGNGYKPLADIYRYIGIKALEPNSKPLIIVKGRQIGLTTAASALEMYFMCSGLFGVGDKPPIRIMHTFPFLELAAAYSKTKLTQMMNSSKPIEEEVKKGAKPKSYVLSKLDMSTPTNNSLTFKQFVGGNHLWIESIGLDGDRVMGRQLCLDTDIPTINGFKKLKDIKEGDQLFDENGNICNVTKVHPINLTPEAYRITFDDDVTIDACADHLWFTQTKRERNKKCGSVKNTKQIFKTLKIGKENNHSIPCTQPINFPKKDLLIDPYLLGLWLGDGSRGGLIETMDPEILDSYENRIVPSSIRPDKSRSCAYRVIGLTTNLHKLKLLQNTHSKLGDFYHKHIPEEYMRGSFEQRLSLLQGLLDTDGHCDKFGNIEFVQVNKELAFQVFELVLSLGIKAKIYTRESWRYFKRNKDKYRIRFVTNLPVFRIKRKIDRIKKTISIGGNRYIKNVERIQSKPMRCLTVDSPSHLFLVTKHFIPTHNTADVLFADEFQRTTDLAIGNTLKILTTAKYGNRGVQVFFGTPRKKGSSFYKQWMMSNQQYYYLGCERCKEHFPLYTPGSDDWEKIWIKEYIVKCTHCGFEQDKREATERGKWVSMRPEEDSRFVGFHLNQLYMPMFTKEDILNEKPGIHPINTERVFHNEVLGEFFQGDASPITPEEIRENCADTGRKFRASITPDEEKIVVLGIDYGLRADLEQLANPDTAKVAGQSYSTAVLLVSKGPGLLSIEFATKFKRNDMESKKGIIDQLMRQYSVQLAVGDIGYSNDFSAMLHNEYGDRYIVSRAHNKVNNHIKYSQDAFPKEVVFERDYYIGELFEQMKKGMIRFPFGDYEKIAWLIDHCSSMDIKPSISRGGEPSIHYVKGSTPNDGFMALLNAYIAYKFILTKGFQITNPLVANENLKNKNKILATLGTISRRV